jgi:hypothetical protein
MLLDLGAAQDLIGGLICAGGSIAGGDGGLFAVASVLDVFIDELLFTVGELELASCWIDSSF